MQLKIAGYQVSQNKNVYMISRILSSSVSKVILYFHYL